MPYYSAKLHVVCLIDDSSQDDEKLGYLCDYSIVVFRADDFEKAWPRALELGYQQEQSYNNPDGKAVRWAFRGIEDIQELGDDLDGQEVGSVLDYYKPKTPLAFNTKFSPETHVPSWMTSPASETDS